MKMQAVSEVIGTLILVGVVFIGIVLVGLLLLSNPTPSKVPVLDTIISNTSTTIYIYHKGGDPLFAGQYKIFVNGTDQTASFTIMSPGTEPWSVGETLTATLSTMPRKVAIVFTGLGGGASVITESDLYPVLTIPAPVPNPPSMAWSNSPAFGNATTSFQFTDSSTGPNINAYFWDFNDASTTNTMSPAHVFPGTTAEYYQYSINHSATDSSGTFWATTSWLNRSSWVTVYKNLTPTINFTQDTTSGAIPLTVQFTATQVGAIKNDSWSWNFGDTGTSTSYNPSHTYNAAGIYTVSLTATNYTLGVSPTFTKASLITVSNPPPTVAWSRSPAFGNATTPFTFTDSSTGTNITAYFWDFNDANTSTLQSPNNKQFPTPTAEYQKYNINHSATDSPGTDWAVTSWLNRSSWVTVYKNLTPTTNFTQDKTSGAIPLTVQFTSTQVGAIKNDSWYWDFGDSGTSNSYKPSHIYTTAGIYTVSLNATNYTLGVSPTFTKASLITASNPPPSMAWSNSPAFGNATTSFTFTDSSTCTNCTGINAYFWNFTDANTSTTKSPNNKKFPNTTAEYYPYTINHSATDSFGTDWAVTSWLNRSSWVTIYKNLTPTINFTQDTTSGAIPLTVQFTSTQVGAIKNDTWYWDFGDTGTSTSYNPSHTYTSTGHYTVSLTATNYTLGVSPTFTKPSLITASPNPAWYCGWLYRKNITLNKTAVSGTLPLAYFPVLISYTDSDLSARALASGNDILFTDSTGTNKLPHEIESYSGGTLAAWVNVSSLSPTSNTTIFMYYGNSGASSQQDPNHVWDTNFKGVWHYNSTGTFLDSTANSNTGTNTGSGDTGGQIARARNFPVSNDWIQVAASASINNLFAGGGTFSAWIYPRSRGEATPDGGRIGDKSSAYIGSNGWGFGTYTGINLSFRRGFSTTDGHWCSPTGSIPATAWSYVVVTYDDTSTANNPIVYINGVASSITRMTTPVGSAETDASQNMRIGNSAAGQLRDFDGIIDEVRASKTIRSADWIKTEYTNQANPAKFHYNMTQESWTC